MTRRAKKSHGEVEYKFEFKPAVRPKPGEEREAPPLKNIRDTSYEDGQAVAKYLWEITGNPLFAWEAFSDAEKAGEPKPEWARRIVMGGIDRLLALRDGDNAVIVKALGLTKPSAKKQGWAKQYALIQNQLKAAVDLSETGEELNHVRKWGKTGTDDDRARKGKKLFDAIEILRERDELFGPSE